MNRKNWDSDWIYFSRRARRGMFVLLFFFIIIAVLPRLYFTFINPPKDIEIEITSLTPTDEVVKAEENTGTSKYKQPEAEFDPNTYTIQDWKNVGLSERQAESILKYLSKGGSLKVKTDLKKLYVIDEELYRILEPKINLPDAVEKLSMEADNKNEQKAQDNYGDLTSETEQKEPQNNSSKIFRKISVNTATSEELRTIRGIGSFFAEEIIKLRESYGGLIYPEQLLSIYRMDEEKLEDLRLHLKFDRDEVKKININTAEFKALQKHPLISSDIAHWIIYYRENHKEFSALDNLLLCPYIDRKVLKELEPYLKTQ